MADGFGFEERPAMGKSNFCSKEGARELQRRIETYWAERGYQIQVDLHERAFTAEVRAVRYDIRSNLKDGLPPNILAAVRI